MNEQFPVGVELEQAVTLLLSAAKPVRESEEIPLEHAAGRICAKQLCAPINQPPFDRSPLDGFALCASSTVDVSQSNPVCLRVIGEECAGAYFSGLVRPGEAVEIMTGARIPDGCDCVIRQEETERRGQTVRLFRELRKHQNICFAGEDVRKGTPLAQEKDKLTPIHLGALASVGYCTVQVLRRVCVALLHTGDELTPPGEPLAPGKIYDSSTPVLVARLRELGIELAQASGCKDDPHDAAAWIAAMLPQVDAVITTGGVSMGKKDILHETLTILGADKLFWQLNMKPGSPMIGARAQGKPILCLSGNPFAALATFELVVRPVLSKLAGDSSLVCLRKQMVLGDDFEKESQGRRFIRARCADDIAYLPQSGQHSSGSLSSMIGCNVFIDIPAGTPALHKGDRIEVVVL